MDALGAAKVLTMCAAFDNRAADVGGAVAALWAEALRDVRQADAEAAVIEHYKTSTEYARPAHLLAIVKRYRTERWRAHGPLDLAATPPTELDDDVPGTLEWLRLYRKAVGEGATRELAARHACRETGLPYREELPPSPEGARRVRALIEGARIPRPPARS